MKLTFYGATRAVTGSNFLLDTGKSKILVECGLWQGCRFCEEKNYGAFPYDPKEIDAVLLTHAHIDHSGRLPKLIKEGFCGKIFSTDATKDLVEPVLYDSAEVMRRESKETGVPPLFKEKDVRGTMRAFEGVEYDGGIKVTDDLSCVFRDAGHILGSAIIEILSQGKKIVFSGDLGNSPTPLLRQTEMIENADWIVLEATYGDRIHEGKDERRRMLEDIIEETIRRKGVLMIPAFALERTQELLYEFNILVENKRIPRIPIFIDSPLALRATEIYSRYQKYYNKEASYLIASGDELFQFPGLTFTHTVEESKAINVVPPPKVIIAGSGMSNGGRIVHHERRYLSDPASAVLFIGYQAAGTLGRRIFDGGEEVSIFGERIPVRCQIKAIGGYSAHADQKMLMEWVDYSKQSIKKIFVVHGEEESVLTLAGKIKDVLGIDAYAPLFGDTVEL